MVEDIVGVHAELCPITLGYSELFGEREIRSEQVRAAERVEANVPESSRSRTRESGSRPSNTHRRNRSKPAYDAGGRIPLHTKRKGSRSPAGAADAYVFVSIAITVGRSPGQASAPVCCGGQSPPADDVVHQSVGVAHVFLALAEWQLIHKVRYPHVVAALVIRAIRYARVDGVVVAVIVRRVRISVVGNKLQSLRESLLDFD